MRATPTKIPDVLIVEPRVFEDGRGFFLETWEKRKFRDLGIDHDFVQDNHSRSSLGTLRGLHYQIKNAQGKLVRVTAGEVFDVAVDIRRSSPTFGQWVGETLSADNHRMLWVPPGFAHGFLVISEYADFMYKCTDYYSPKHERCIRWDDPAIGVEWPGVKGASLTLSSKDLAGGSLIEAEVYD